MDTEAFHVVIRIIQGVYFQLTTIAGSSIHMTDREAPGKAFVQYTPDLDAQLLDIRIFTCRSFLGDDTGTNYLCKQVQHDYKSCPEYETFTDLLQTGKSGTILFCISTSNAGQMSQLGSRG